MPQPNGCRCFPATRSCCRYWKQNSAGSGLVSPIPTRLPLDAHILGESATAAITESDIIAVIHRIHLQQRSLNTPVRNDWRRCPTTRFCCRCWMEIQRYRRVQFTDADIPVLRDGKGIAAGIVCRALPTWKMRLSGLKLPELGAFRVVKIPTTVPPYDFDFVPYPMAAA